MSTLLFRRGLALAAGRKLLRAEPSLAGDNGLECWANGEPTLKNHSSSAASVSCAGVLIPTHSAEFNGSAKGYGAGPAKVGKAKLGISIESQQPTSSTSCPVRHRMHGIFQ